MHGSIYHFNMQHQRARDIRNKSLKYRLGTVYSPDKGKNVKYIIRVIEKKEREREWEEGDEKGGIKKRVNRFRFDFKSAA